MAETNASLLVDSKCALGEGIQWNADHGRVYWTDIYGDVLWSCDEYGQDVQELSLESGLCSFAFAGDRILAAFAEGLYWLTPESGERELIRAFQPDLPKTRMNDGVLDRQGRFVVGGIDEEAMRPITPVWSVSPDRIDSIIDGVGCANSIAFSPDGGTMYFADTASTEIFAFDYDTATGRPSNRRVFVNSKIGKPDGSTVDADGALWNTRFGAGCVQKFVPDGTEAGRIALDVPNPTCCCLGGRDLDKMFITTARILMSDAQLEEMPQAGGLYVATPGVIGLPHGSYAQ